MQTMQTPRRRESSSDLPQINFNSQKILDFLSVGMREDTRLVVSEGTIRSAKTTSSIELLHLRIQHMMTAKYALIACEDYNAVRTNILESKLGLMSVQPDLYDYGKAKIGGYFVKVAGTDKEIIICGYSDASRWKKILGKDIEIVMIDECNIADEQFVNETLGRQSATDRPLTILTLNGDDPNLPIYQEIINKCVIVGDCPSSIRADMDSFPVKKRGYFYFHWTFDDNPALTPSMKKSLRHLYPVGSYYHKTRVLGERGKWGASIYADYMAPDLLSNIYIFDTNSKAWVIDPKLGITRYGIGVDIAENRATNVFALVGFDSSYSKAFLVDLMVFKSNEGGMKVGYTKKTQYLRSFLAKHQMKNIEYVAVDSAEGNYILDLKGSDLGRQIIPSYKATIKERIDMNVVLFSRKRFHFSVGYNPGDGVPHDTCIAGYQSYQNAIWVKGQEGKEREDNNLPMNDIMDAIEYAETVHMKALSFAARREVA